MATAQIERVAIRGIVSAVPGNALSIRTIGDRFEASDVERVAKTVGLNHLYRVAPGTTAGDLCIAAAERLLTDLGWERDSIDGVIMVTQTPDHFLPATACVAHGKLNLSNRCLAFDVGMGCSGYIYGLWMVSQFVSSGTCRRVLLLAGDTISQLISPDDKSVAMLFGDAGSATAIEFDADAGAISFVLGSDGTGAHNLVVPAGGFRTRLNEVNTVRVPAEAGINRSAADLYMDGLAIFNFTLQRIPQLVQDTMNLHGWTVGEVDAFLFHQANGFILNKIGKKLGISGDRIPVNIERYGNTSSASIPLLLADDLSGAISSTNPTKLILAGFGVGYSWAGAALTLSDVRSVGVIQV